ncbi:conserved hypothetical protein [uncultured Pleomorphomonas sp.]|uniref:Uncharacterized protein n=1 Tax=uncultured Pleomorphomonas sp. TaxID=442121 RepID=A0A212L7D8_9HYPH|nr:hypothetical protein [uncultured Pleomorphomonas sp.]SCM73425.1 conserved hypothetical protein [uncultured Pleomorphomonas sp.]
MITLLTSAQRAALKWLADHSGDGLFDKNGVLLAGGETAPIMRGTWNRLAEGGYVEFYRPITSGRGRLRITDLGRRAAE